MLVSGVNFLTIALGARFLPISEQGKLAYIISAYMVTVLINVAVIFSVAPVVRSGLQDNVAVCYRCRLLHIQFLLAGGTAIIITLAFTFAGAHIGWNLSLYEAGLVFTFIAFQQLADYKRRVAYVFETPAHAFVNSLVTYGMRIAALLVFRPSTIVEMLWLLIASAAFSGLAALVEFARAPRGPAQPSKDDSGLATHLRLSKWSALNAPVGWISFFMPVYFLGIVESVSAVAILVSIRSISSVANVILELLETIVPKWLSSVAVADGVVALKAAALKILYVGASVWLIGLIFILMFGGDLIRLVLGTSYAPYAFIFLISWGGNGVHFIGRVIGIYFRTRKNTFAEFLGSVGGLAGFVASIPMIMGMGMQGAAWSYVTVPVGIALAQWLYFRFGSPENHY